MTAASRKLSSRSSTPSAAEEMARQQRDISVSEFFAKNRHLLGFDNPRKALLTTVKEAVDNALDACEEAKILPDLYLGIEQLGETRFRLVALDNGPGILEEEIEKIFGKLLYGSKFHRLKMSRGQQGIGIAAAGMYGLMTTGRPMVIISKPYKSKPARRVVLAMDTKKNKADVTESAQADHFPHATGTQVEIELEGRYNRGRQSVDEYLEQTAIANPHVQILYRPPANGNAKNPATEAPLLDDLAHGRKLARTAKGTTTTPGGMVVYPRTVRKLPPEPKTIKPHPRGVELGTLLKMLKDTSSTQLGGFLQNEFCRVSLKGANALCRAAQKLCKSDTPITNRTYLSRISHKEAESLYQAIQETRFMAPPTDCLAPIGVKQILAGLLKGVKAEFYTAATRDPAVYRGNPFQIEVGLAYGGRLPAKESCRVIRYANRVPLLYQQSACCAYKSVIETTWRNYGLSQSRGALPEAPLVIMVHMASVWVPFTSESKEAIADYDEIRKEMKLALAECGRKLKAYVNRKRRSQREGQRRDIFHRYIGEVVGALHAINPKLKPGPLRKAFEAVAKLQTQAADLRFDEDGKPIKVDPAERALERDAASVIVKENVRDPGEEEEEEEGTKAPRRRKQPANDDDGARLF